MWPAYVWLLSLDSVFALTLFVPSVFSSNIPLKYKEACERYKGEWNDSEKEPVKLLEIYLNNFKSGSKAWTLADSYFIQITLLIPIKNINNTFK